MCTVIIGNQRSDHLRIRVFGYSGSERDEHADYYDSNWIGAEIRISAGAFSAHLESDIFLRSDEFQSFLKQIEPLYESLIGTAKYVSLEDWINMEISGDGHGHMLAKGYVIDKHCEGNKLNFTIHFDQTSLPQTINDLKRLLKKYPVIGRE